MSKGCETQSIDRIGSRTGGLLTPAELLVGTKTDAPQAETVVQQSDFVDWLFAYDRWKARNKELSAPHFMPGLPSSRES